MPDLTKETVDIEPIVLQLRTAARIAPIMIVGYFSIQFFAIGYIWGFIGSVVGLLVGFVLGSLVSAVITPAFTWMIHVLFLLHGIRARNSDNSLLRDED